MNKGLTPRRVLEHEPKVRAICEDLIARAAARGGCDFVRDVAAPLPMIVIGDLLGVEPEDRDMLLRWSDDLVEGTAISAPPETMMRALRAFEEYADYHRRVAADRRAAPRLAVISAPIRMRTVSGGPNWTRSEVDGASSSTCADASAETSTRAETNAKRERPSFIPPLYFAAEENLRRPIKTALLGRLQDGAAEQGIYVD